MIRGEFRLNDGRVIANQFTTNGMQQVIKAAFHQIPQTWYCGLCAHNQADFVGLTSIFEPTIGVHGYGREALPFGPDDWPLVGLLNGESYIESRELAFTPSGGAFDGLTNRLFLTDGTVVCAISGPLWSGLQAQATPLTTKYRLYFR